MSRPRVAAALLAVAAFLYLLLSRGISRENAGPVQSPAVWAPAPAVPGPAIAQAQTRKVEAAAEGPPAPPKFRGPVKPEEPVWSTPFDAVMVMQADAVNLIQQDPRAEGELPFIRWVWVQSGIVEEVQALSHAIALVSRTATSYRPEVVGGILVRIDLRRLGNDREVQRYIDFWEELAFDPSIARNTTRDTLELLSAEVWKNYRYPKWERQWKRDKDGSWERASRKLEAKSLTTDVIVVRENGREAERAGLSKLQAACQTLAPIVESKYFIGRAMSTIKDRDKVLVGGKEVERENLFSVIWGGLYNEFRGIRKSVVKGRTDLDQFLLDFGVGAGLQELLDSRTTGRVSIAHSGVTKKPRLVIYFGGRGVHPGIASPFGSITLDIRDRDVDHGDRSYKNLLTFRVRAFEVILIGANGHLVYTLFGEQGQLLEEAVAEVVRDPGRLQGPKDCISCHGAAGGWQPLVGDAPPKGRRIDLLTDLSNRKRSTADVIDFLAGAYGPSPEQGIRRANEDNGQAIVRATGFFRDVAATKTATVSSEWIAKIWNSDRYNAVSPAEACRRLGLQFKGGDGAVEALATALPKVGDVEDPTLGLLLKGKSVTPQDFALSYSDLVHRVHLTRKEQP